MYTQGMEDATRALLLLLHANEGKKEVLKQNVYEFELIKTMCREGTPLGDARITELIALGEAATDVTTFANAHRKLVEKFEQHVEEMTFFGQVHLDGFFTEMTLDSTGKVRKSERRVLSNIAPDAQSYIGYAVMHYIFQRQAELSKTAMTSMGATKAAQAIFKKKKKHNGGARVKFLNYATFFAYYGLVELFMDNENGKPIAKLRMTDEGIAWWSRICLRTRALFAKHEARIAELEASLATVTPPVPRTPAPTSPPAGPLLGVAVAAILALVASSGYALAENQGASISDWRTLMSRIDSHSDPAYFAPEASEPAASPMTTLSGIAFGAAQPALDAAATDIAAAPIWARMMTVSDASSTASSTMTIRYLIDLPVDETTQSEHKSSLLDDSMGLPASNGWLGTSMKVLIAAPDADAADGAIESASGKLGRAIDRLGETEPLDMALLGSMKWWLETPTQDAGIAQVARYRPIDRLGETEPLQVDFVGTMIWSPAVWTGTFNTSPNVGAADVGAWSINAWDVDAKVFEMVDGRTARGTADVAAANRISIEPATIPQSRTEFLAHSLGRPIDRLGETEPLIMAGMNAGDT